MSGQRALVQDSKRSHWIVRTNYRLRVASFFLAFVAIGMDLYTKDTGARLWTLLALQFLVYPHLLYWRARRAKNPQRAELDHLLVDSLLFGVWVAALHFPLWPTFTMWIGCSLNVTMTSGMKGTVRSQLAFMAGVLIAIAAFGFQFEPDTVWPTTVLTIFGTAAYLIAIGNTSHERNQQLRGTREKLRDGEHVLQQQLAEIQVLQGKLKEQAVHDPMTGLFNRRYLDTIVPHELARCTREGIPLCLMMMDIDHFKHVNDTYGHQGGDEVLKALAALLSDAVRACDVACRYGGEEFLLLLPNMPVAHALLRAEEWRAAIADMAVEFGGKSIRVTASFGIACYPEDGWSGDELTRSADLALYRAKAEGRDRVVLFSAEMAPAA